MTKREYMQIGKEKQIKYYYEMNYYCVDVI